MSVTYEFKVNIDASEFDTFVNNHPLASMFQLSTWASLKPAWSNFTCGVYSNHKLVGCALVLVRSQYGLKMAYAPRGPLLDYNNANLVSFFFTQLKYYCSKNGISTLIFDPNVIVNRVSVNDKETADSFDASNVLTIISKCGAHFRGFTKSIEDTTLPRYQLSYDLMAHEDIIDGLPRKTKEKVNHYLDKGLTIRESKDAQLFHQLIEYTEKRKGIALRNADYFNDLLTAYPKSTILIAQINCDEVIDNLMTLKESYEEKIELYKETAPKKCRQWETQINRLTKEVDETTQLKNSNGNIVDVSALLVVCAQQTCELLYSGLNEQYRKYHPAYALRYKAMLWAKQQGCTRFNFGGVEGTLDDGLYTFKASFNPDIDVYIGEFILPCKLSNIVFEKGLPLLRKYRDKKIAAQKKSK